jgi:hypothetical protein
MTDAAEQDAAGAEVVVAEEETAAAAAAAPAEAGAVEGPVCAEQQESVLGVQLKVEVLTALVSKMEHLVGRAEATARALQVGGGCALCSRRCAWKGLSLCCPTCG